MEFLMKPGIRMKRWIFLGFIGVVIFVLGIVEIFSNKDYNITIRALYLFLSLIGIVIMYIAFSEFVKSFISLINSEKVKITINDKNIEELVDEKRVHVGGPKVVVIGGGTGLSTMLRGLKLYTNNITAIVTVGDDGGGSGKLRADLGMLPPGDIRNCILALADTEPIMEDLLQYRFKEGSLKGQNFGNLFLAAMAGISDNFEDAVQKMSSVLAVTGKVLPVTLDDMKLIAELENGSVIEGESIIPEEVVKQKSKIKQLRINPERAKPLMDALIAIKEADAIVMGPGSLYTSILPNLMISDIGQAVCETKAEVVYICNIMTQRGETEHFTDADHVRVLHDHLGTQFIDTVLVNTEAVPEEYLNQQKNEEYLYQVKYDFQGLRDEGCRVVSSDFIKLREKGVYHDGEKVIDELFRLLQSARIE